MANIVLNDITSGYNTSRINANFEKLETAVNTTLLNTDSGNATMKQDLDMNGFRLLNPILGNLLPPVLPGDAVRLSDLNAESTARLSADSQELIARQLADTNEANTRLSADLALGSRIDTINAAQVSGLVGYPTLAAMNADLSKIDGTVAIVTNDPTPANNTSYRKSGAPGVGTWVVAVDRITLLQNNLSASTGANSIGFFATGTGAVTRTVQDKIRDTVSVKDFGAIGDGGSHALSTRFATLTDAQAVYPFVTTLADEIDWAAFTAALNASSNKRVYVPGGIYIINRAISITTSFVTLDGNDQFSPVIKTTSATDDIIRMDCGTGVIQGVAVRNLVLDSSVQKTGGAGIKVQVTSPGSFSSGLFEYLRLQPNMANGIDVMSSYWLTMNEINICGVGQNKIGLKLAGQDANCRVIDTKITKFRVIGAGAGTGSTISYGCLIDDFVEGLYCWNMSLESAALNIDLFINNRTSVRGNAPKNMWFHQLICDSVAGQGVAIANCQTVKFTDLWAAGATTNNISVVGGTDIEFKGTTCLVSKQHGIVIGAAAKQVRFLGGVIDGCGWQTPGVWSGVSVSDGATDWTIKDFDFIRDGSSWVQLYDIILQGNSDRFIIEGNRLTGGNPSTTRIHNGNTVGFKCVIKNNIGYNPILDGITTPAVPASGTAITNTTGTDVTAYIIGGVVNSIAVGGIFTGQSTSPSTVCIPAGTTVQLFYTSAPTWKWLGN